MSDDTVTHRLSTEGVDLLTLAGVNDANLIELSRLTGVKVSLRGDAMTMSGPVEIVERAAVLAQRMIDQAKQQNSLDADDVLRLSEDGAGAGRDDGAGIPGEMRIVLPAERVQRALETRVIEIAPLAYMRGRTLSEAFVILDEAQNATSAQMKMFLTRLGINSKAVITGDKTQIDLPAREQSGLIQVERILHAIDGIGFHYFNEADVIRHRLVRDIIKAYAKDSGAT